LIENTLHIESRKSETEEFINIVLAEDDIDDVLIFKLALKELETAVKLNHVDSADKLLALLNQLLPDIIFLDINLPRKDGLACVIEIRKNSAFDNVPVVLISGYTFSKYIEDGFAGGANYYLIKTSSVSHLAASLKRIFSIDWKKVMYYPPINEFVIGDTEGVA
jgi:CheY-like chemotaxis protein